MPRRSRRRFAILAMLGLLFAQFSLLAYACPKQLTPMVAAPVAMSDCAGMSGSQPEANLCELHCKDAAKAASAAVGDETPSAVNSYVLTPVTTSVLLAGSRHPTYVPLAVAAAPPFAIQFCRFLI